MKYHLKCYTKALRNKASRERGQTTSNSNMRIRLAEYEFTSLIDSYLTDGAVLNLSECEMLHVNILVEYGIDASQLRNKNRPHVRKIITENIHHAKIVNSAGNQPATVSSVQVEDEVMGKALESTRQ